MQLICGETGRISGLLSKNLEKDLQKLTENDILLIDSGRSLDTVDIIYQCLNRRIAFTFTDGQYFPATCIIDKDFRVRRLREGDERNRDICYVINTSGTSGISKRVAVPFDCIMPNIEYFGKVLEISEYDIILCSTSFHFDPSIIEMFLFFKYKTRLLLTPDNYRNHPYLLNNAIEKYQPTIGQFTPNVARMLDQKMLQSFRCVLIGGSIFPRELYTSAASKTRIFDVYGVTEVSCWATIREIKDSENYLGDPIPGTILEVSKNQELILKGSRKCFVNGKMTAESGHKTGDLVEILDGKIRIVGRKDGQLKIRGMRMNLEEMTRIIGEKLELNAHFMLYRHKIITLFVEGTNDLKKVERILDANLQKDFHPSHIEFIEKFQINRNGKLDQNYLCEKVDLIYNGNFVKIVREKYKIDLEREAINSFVNLGFDSLISAELSLCFPNSDEVFRLFLDPKTIVSDFLFQMKLCFVEPPKIDGEVIETHSISELEPSLKWSHSLRKCIDGNPLVIGNLVYTASHFGIVMCIAIANGNIVWENRYETRFEASPINLENDIVIGGFDGILYRFDGLNGNIIWKFKTGDQIKAACFYDGKDSIYCISYDRYLYKIEKMSGQMISKKSIGSGSPCAPIRFSNSSSPIFSTIRGKIISENWEYSADSACYSQITHDLSTGNIVIGLVNGDTIVLKDIDGTFINRLNLGNAPIFCAPLKLPNGNWCWALEDGTVVLTNPKNNEILKRWKFPGTRFVRTPQILEPDKIYLQSTTGNLIIWNLNDSTALSIKLSDSDIFSTPFLDPFNKIMISTGRDDYIKCWNFEF